MVPLSSPVNQRESLVAEKQSSLRDVMHGCHTKEPIARFYGEKWVMTKKRIGEI